MTQNFEGRKKKKGANFQKPFSARQDSMGPDCKSWGFQTHLKKCDVSSDERIY